MRTKPDIEAFLGNWVAQNVRGVSDLAHLTNEVDRLAARLTGDARTVGISGGDINRTVGDIDDYLTAQYHRQARA